MVLPGVCSPVMRLRELDGLFDTPEYPITADEFIDRFGPSEVDLPAGAVTVGTVLGLCRPETYASPEEARLAFYGALPERAVGRKGYTDRDPPMPGEAEPVSF